MSYTLTQASRACGKSKATLLRAIRSGRLSAARDEVAGSWLIEESELHRVFPPGTAVPGTDASNEAPRTPTRTDRTAEFEARIRGHLTICSKLHGKGKRPETACRSKS